MISEATLAAAVADWLRSEGWDVFFEVSLEWKLRGRRTIGDARADIVATRNGELTVVECKTVLSFELLAQADRWQPYADTIRIAVPRTKRSEGKDEAHRLCRDFYGFGILELRDPDGSRAHSQYGESAIHERAFPRFHGRTDESLFNSLSPEHKTYAAPGTNRGGQWTSFKKTAVALAAFVASRPEGSTVAEAVSGIEHHYASKASAIGSIPDAVKKGLVPGVRVGWRQRLFPADSVSVSEESAK